MNKTSFGNHVHLVGFSYTVKNKFISLHKSLRLIGLCKICPPITNKLYQLETLCHVTNYGGWTHANI
jgi:hypothetical protein